jgi:hypothetical protein
MKRMSNLLMMHTGGRLGGIGVDKSGSTSKRVRVTESAIRHVLRFAIPEFPGMDADTAARIEIE